jgi:hypothetical protein
VWRDEVKAKVPQVVTPDECDAVICAMAAVADGDDLLCGEELNTRIREELRSYQPISKYIAPDGYRLLKKLAPDFYVKISSYETWLSESKCN